MSAAKGVSAPTVHRIWRAFGLKPHLQATFKPSTDPYFVDKVRDVVGPSDQDIHLIMDNYGTHKTEKVRAWFATRPRYHVHFTPTSASWLNLVERFFGQISEKWIKR